MNQLCIKRKRTTAYHPACNGAIERFHRTLKNALRANCASRSWYDSLALVMLGLRNSVNDTGFSPSQMVFGSHLDLPSQFFAPFQFSGCRPVSEDSSTFTRDLFASMHLFASPSRSHNVPVFVPPELRTCKHVWLRDESPPSSLSPRYTGPFPVISRSDRTATIQRPDRAELVSLDRLKPAFLVSDSVPEEPEDTPTDSPSTPAPSRVAGTVVLAKVPCWPTWPALTISPDGTPLASLKRPAGCIPVQFFGTGRYAYVEPQHVLVFDPSFPNKSRAFARAMDIAKDVISQPPPPPSKTPPSVHFCDRPTICR